MFLKVGNFRWPKLQMTDNNEQLLTLILDWNVHGARYCCHSNLLAVLVSDVLDAVNFEAFVPNSSSRL